MLENSINKEIVTEAAKSPYWRVDEWGMFVEGNDSNSWRDSIGRNLDAYVAWGGESLVEAVWQCFEYKEPHEWQRHPYHKSDDLSRDHISYALILFAMAGRWDYYSYIIHELKWRINKHTTLRGMWLWATAPNLFYVAKIPEMAFMAIWNKVNRCIGDIKPERSQAEWDISIKHNRTESNKTAAKLVFPAYALHNFAWQLYIMPDSLPKRFLQWITRSMAGRHNYVIKALLGGKLTKKELQLASEYRSMTASRWTTTLDELGSRHVVIIEPEQTENDLDRAYMLGVLRLTGNEIN